VLILRIIVHLYLSIVYGFETKLIMFAMSQKDGIYKVFFNKRLNPSAWIQSLLNGEARQKSWEVKH
jgi:hypothetical protein